MNNQTFQRATCLLAHPLNISALFVLLVNDHLIRMHWPGWWSGKLGDFAWLLFAPLAATAIISLGFPKKFSRWEHTLPMAAFLLVGCIFVLVKTIPSVLAAFQWIGKQAYLPVQTVSDFSDLLALPALGFSWYLWKRADSQPARQSSFQTGLLALPFAALLTIANSAMPDYGIMCLSVDGNSLKSSSPYYTFSSSDGGMSWAEEGYTGSNCLTKIDDNRQVEDPRSGTLYRFQPGGPIEQSSDGGKQWQVAYEWDSTSQAVRALQEKRRSNVNFREGPLDAVYDANSGNIVFAMGLDGTLLRTADGEWIWSGVGDYYIDTLDSGDDFPALLMGELILALAGGLLVLATRSLVVSKPKWKYAWTVLGWSAWLVILLIASPAITNDYYSSVLVSTALLVLVMLCLPLAIVASVHLWRSQPRLFVGSLGLAAAAVFLFMLPFGLWALNGLPYYGMAAAFSITFTVVLCVVGIIRTKRKPLAAVE